MGAENTFVRQRCSLQIGLVAVLASLITFAAVKFAAPLTAWHSSWMVVLLSMLGAALNRGMSRWRMAAVLPIASWIATAVVGNALGGI